MEIASLYELYLRHPSVQTDTRSLKKEDIFFALRGLHFNGNTFARQALEQGAAYAVIDEQVGPLDDRMILVDDVLKSLQQLARYHRQQLHIPIVAITGSNGKTTTKELTRAVLATAYRTYATEGNLNNHIGIPLTLLRIRPETEVAVIEMGANHQQEIASYCQIAQPTHGLITNIGKAHLEGFGGIEGVRKGKGELFDYLRQTAGTAFACGDFDYFHEMSQNMKEMIWYGSGSGYDLNGNLAEGLQDQECINVGTDYTGVIHTHLPGAYNLYNVLAAVTIGWYFKVTPEGVIRAIRDYIPDNNRSEILHRGSNTIILDAYNANPSSMKAAIENLASLPGRHKVLMLGAMMELGQESLAEHQALITLIEKYGWEQVVLVGGDFAQTKHPYIYLPDAEAAQKWLEQQHLEQAEILIKGSRSMAMEKIIA